MRKRRAFSAQFKRDAENRGRIHCCPTGEQKEGPGEPLLVQWPCLDIHSRLCYSTRNINLFRAFDSRLCFQPLALALGVLVRRMIDRIAVSDLGWRFDPCP